MGKQKFQSLSSLIFVLICLTSIGLAQDPPHNETADPIITCDSCHSWLPGWVTIPYDAEQETLCKTCHNPAGQAPAMVNVANHIVDGGATIVDCGSCHNPHLVSYPTDPHSGLTNPNLSLIRSDTYQYVDGAVPPAIFQNRPDHYSFTTAPFIGICQTCHTATNHHTNTGAGTGHFSTEDCIGCHPHENGFLPTGDFSCTTCHASAQNNGDGVPASGRRAIVDEFPLGTTHAHYGTEVNEDACLVCHSNGTHMDGYVELVDPDDGSIYRFIYPGDLASDPDVSDFCAGCHDSDGATRLATPLDPFGNGNAAPAVAEAFAGTLQWNEWYGDVCFGSEGTLRGVNSHHDISDADQAFSGARLECLNCHGAHISAASQPMADPFNTNSPFSGEDNDFCLACHSGGVSPADPGFPPDVTGPTIALRGIGSCEYTVEPWHVEYDWAHVAHGLDSKRGWDGYSGAQSYVMDCKDCHDPHGSVTPTNLAGNPYMIRDYVDGTMFVDDGGRPLGFNGPPWDIYGTAGDVTVSISGIAVDWGSSQSLCIKCHVDWLASYSWHSMCNGCQTCHGHGQAWGGNDWGVTPPIDSTLCPVPGKNLTGPDLEKLMLPHRLSEPYLAD